MKRIFLAIFLLVALGMQAQREVYRSASPEFTVTLPDGGGDGRCVVLVPGGGYNHVAKGHEGADWIPFFTSQGIAVVVTKYTLPEGDREKPLGDIRQTFKYLREHGAQWGINPNGIGIMGFSAGGHLASAFTNSEVGDQRPAFCILFYPVIRLDVKQHLGMAKKFLGADVTDEQRKQWSTQNMVTDETPQTVIFAADDDPVIEASNSAEYYLQLKKHQVPATMHIYPNGGHGFGFRTSFPYHQRMVQDLTDWLMTVRVPGAHAKKVACIGNSITYGARLKYRHQESWPAQLQQLVGDAYWVKNFGVSGTTMTPGSNAYTSRQRWQDAKDFLPDIVFIKLGTNDVKPGHWKGADAYVAAYQQMIDDLRALPSHPRIVLCYPATSYRTQNHLDSDIVANVLPLITKIAKKNRLDVIDLHTPTSGHEELFPDKLHPDPTGEGIIAHAIAEYLKK